MAEYTHHHVGDPDYNNPHANRFDKISSKRPDGFSRVAYVLHGGGALGAYQLGVIKGLMEAGYTPDWIAATSIGAIQAGIIAGNTPENQIPRLEEFWKRVSTHTPFDVFGHNHLSSDMYHNFVAHLSIMFGQGDFFRPRVFSPYMQIVGNLDKLSIYDTYPLRKTLLDLIDFERLNKSPIRLSLGAVEVSTGHLRYFNNIHYCIGPEHIMASGALPPGFPAVKIGSEYYWDGGIHSNTPLEVIFDAIPRRDTLCFVIDCFGGTPFIPCTMEEVTERMKDINYSTHAQGVLKHHVERFHLKTELQKLTRTIGEDQLKDLQKVMDKFGGFDPNHFTIVHVSYSGRLHRGASKDYNFSQVTIRKRIDMGYRDIKAALEESDQWSMPTNNLELRVYEAPNNLSRFSRNDY
jgi:NTE family protein